MSITAKSSALLPICAAAVTVFGSVLTAVPAHADGGCVPNDAAGQVPRKANDSDMVCVSPAIAALVQQENANKDAGYAGGGAYGPLTCINGLVWREAYDGDGICVTPARRTETWQQNANAGVGATGGLKPNNANAGGGGGGAPTGDSSGEMLALFNDQRTAAGCAALPTNPQLTAAAARHANDMLKNKMKSDEHNGSDGSTTQTRIQQSGYYNGFNANHAGEIVFGYPGMTPQAAIDGFMASPNHKAQITDCSWTDIGVAAPSGGGSMYVVAVFGKHS
jgi:uncharacterized protein YkwD